jgi:hypothetical protein
MTTATANTADATFTSQTAPELGPRGRRYELACDHGTTILALVPGGAQIPEVDLLRLVLLRHSAEQTCACTARLWGRVAAAEARL